MPRERSAKTTWPGVWPGQWRTSNAISPTATLSPPASQRSGTNGRAPGTPNIVDWPAS